MLIVMVRNQCPAWKRIGSSPRLFALFVQATEVKLNDVDFNPEFVSRMIPKLEWSALVQAAEEVSLTPVTIPSVSGYSISFLNWLMLIIDQFTNTLTKVWSTLYRGQYEN